MLFSSADEEKQIRFFDGYPADTKELLEKIEDLKS
jgi:hypothetical protein